MGKKRKIVHHAPNTPFPCHWVTLHSLARVVDEEHYKDPVAQSKYVNLVYFTMDLFMCKKCQGHMGQYLRENPLPRPQRTQTNQWRYFDYMLEFHNTHNDKAGIERMSHADALELYRYGSDGGDVCPAGMDCKLDNGKPAMAGDGGDDSGYEAKARLASGSAPSKPVNPFAVAAGAAGVVWAGVLLGAIFIK